MFRPLKISFCLVFPLVAFAVYGTNANKQLNSIDTQITHMQARMSHEQKQRSHIQQALQKMEIAAGKIANDLQKTDVALQQEQQILDKTRLQQQKNEKLLTQQQTILEKQIRSAYMLGAQPDLKLLLDPKQSANTNRLLIYYQYFAKNKLEDITQLQNTLHLITTTQQEINNHYQTLKQLQQTQLHKKNQFDQLYQQRSALLQKLNNSMQSQNDQLSELLLDKRKLESTLSQLQSNSSYQNFGTSVFSQLQGHLLWPTKGKVLNNFGTQIYQSELRWNGDLIDAPQGQPVYAIAQGKIVFAKWLTGYGLMLIINHGNGFMTLYGRNQFLYKKEGDIVHAGDLIATVGDSGGYQTPALYFAIWHNAQPLDPAQWCHA